MNWSSWLLWGFLATIVLTTISAGTQGLGLTRMNFPYMLGSILTPDRDRAKLYGFWMHLAAGLVFSLIYVWIFQSLGKAGWWRGALIGICHGIVRAGSDHVFAAGTASPHGQRAARAGSAQPAGAPRISGAALRCSNPGGYSSLACRIRRNPGRVLSAGLIFVATKCSANSLTCLMRRWDMPLCSAMHSRPVANRVVCAAPRSEHRSG